MEDKYTGKANLVAVDMGYGHQRAAYPLQDIAIQGVINANEYEGVSEWEKAVWKKQRGSYEWVSYLKKIPILGPTTFWIMDRFQQIPDFYPQRDLGAHTMQQHFFFSKIKQGVGRDLIKKIAKNKRPLLATFPVPVYFAEYWRFKGQIFCTICDADISRFWAPINPAKSKAKYFVPTERAARRLAMYGVKKENIIFTGFPLPKENIGGLDMPILKADLAARLTRLDPTGTSYAKYSSIINNELTLQKPNVAPKAVHLVFAIGGAGAQAEVAIKFLASIANDIKKGKYKLTLVAGVHKLVKDIFETELKKYSFKKDQVEILFAPSKNEYFQKFNQILRLADILITKPSELSFYAGLGLPIIMTEPVGAQEFANREWLMTIGAGLDAKDWRYANEWLNDWLNDGRLARAAFLGYYEAENLGTYNIENIIKYS